MEKVGRVTPTSVTAEGAGVLLETEKENKKGIKRGGRSGGIRKLRKVSCVEDRLSLSKEIVGEGE